MLSRLLRPFHVLWFFIIVSTLVAIKLGQAPLVQAQATTGLIGPELAFFDPAGEQGVMDKVVTPNDHTGEVQVINEIGGAPFNPAPKNHVTLRLETFGPDTPLDVFVNYANNLRNSNLFPSGTIVFLGVELNNVSLEYPVVGADPKASPATKQALLRKAGQAYGRQYIAFASALVNSNFRVAPAPPDLYNGDWDPVPFIDGFLDSLGGRCNLVDVLVANVFDVTPAIPGYGNLDTYKYLESRICGRKVVHFGGWGPDPNTQPPPSVAEQVKWLDETPLPAGIESAATLLIDPCKDSNVTKKDWLFHIPTGQAYDQNGNDVLSYAKGSCVPGKSKSAALTLIYPKTTDEASKYLANSQVYCAPEQLFVPIVKGNSPTLNNCEEATKVEDVGPNVSTPDKQCNKYEYPLVGIEESWKVPSLSFPLFRGQSNISVESDLSRVKPGETIAEALSQNARPDYAPQFYLSSPEMQCATVSRYLHYINDSCSNYAAKKKPDDICEANSKIKLPDGKSYRLVDLLKVENNFFANESNCADFQKQAADKTILNDIVRAIAPQAPKVFKMGFFVQHTWLYDKRGGADSLIAQYGDRWLTAWFDAFQKYTGKEPPRDQIRHLLSLIDPRPSEKVTVVPIWYNAGLASSEYDQHQTDVSYAIEPPTTRPDDSFVPPKNVSNFVGPLWKTYASILTPQTQDQIARKKYMWVWANSQLQQQTMSALGNGSQVSLSLLPDNMKEILPPPPEPLIPCINKECLCFRNDDKSGLPAAVAQLCQGQTLADLRATFPSSLDDAGNAAGGSSSTIADINSFKLPTDDFLRTLKAQIVARVNAGIQITRPYQKGDNYGPLSVRSLQRCTAEAKDDPTYAEPYGIQEKVNAIAQPAVQSGIKGTVDDVMNFIRAKILHQPADGGQLWNGPTGKRTSRAYIILPDDAMTIETLQENTTPAFLSPEMYNLIMTGESDMYPFNKNKTSGKPSFLSAFLRTIGLDRVLNTKDEGYDRYKKVVQNYYCQNGSPIAAGAPYEVEDPTWYRHPKEFTEEKPNCADGHTTTVGVIYVKLAESLVKVDSAVQGAPNNPNSNVPGQLSAINEYTRRMAFTPLHMQPYKTYPGLEKFYNAIGYENIVSTNSGKLLFSGLSDYFKALFDIDQRYQYVKSAPDTCGVVFVDKAKSDAYTDQFPAFVKALAASYQVFNGGRYWNGVKNNRVFAECGGGNCASFVAQLANSLALCKGDSYLNPYFLATVAFTEVDTGNPTQQGTGYYWGCQPFAFSQYSGPGSYQGLSCQVAMDPATMNGAGVKAIHPLMPSIVAGATDLNINVYNACNPQGLGQVAYGATVGRNETYEDGLACFVGRMQNGCEASVGLGLTADAYSAFKFGWNGGNNGHAMPPSRTQELGNELAVLQAGKAQGVDVPQIVIDQLTETLNAVNSCNR